MIDKNLQRLEALLSAKEVVLTSREMSLLAVAITEMVSAGLNPWDEQFVIQIVAGDSNQIEIVCLFVYRILFPVSSSGTCVITYYQSSGSILRPTDLAAEGTAPGTVPYPEGKVHRDSALDFAIC